MHTYVPPLPPFTSVTASLSSAFFFSAPDAHLQHERTTKRETERKTGKGNPHRVSSLRVELGAGRGPDPDPTFTRKEPARGPPPSPFPFSFVVRLGASCTSAENMKGAVVGPAMAAAGVATVAAEEATAAPAAVLQPLVEAIGDVRPVGCGYVIGRRPLFVLATGLACSEQAVQGPRTLTSIVQSMAGNQRSQASPTGDTTTPPKEKATTVSFYHFMSMLPPVFTGDSSPDKAEEWIEEIERIFEVLEVPGGNKVNFGSYMLKGDAKRWWKSTREIQFADQQMISWRQFRDSFFSTYFPVQTRNKKMREFLDLQQNHLGLEEYITKYRHLEAYCPHLYTTAEARADKFVYGLRDGLRGRVMSGSPHNLDEAVTMARRMEEDWVRTQRDHQKKTSQHTQGGRMPVKHHHPAGRARPYERHDDRTFRRNRPDRGETTQGSVASPTSPRCPTCSRAHPGKPC
ncbi:hypothetical protein EJ110_NYTH54727 [Nymphaea thermarum]|nr:hypothetical protein EJ110_NYTH54727 [Nymphaea thermarum]